MSMELNELEQLDTRKPVEQVGQAISLLAAGRTTRQIAAEMGPGWSAATVCAFKNKADVKALVEQASRALLSRSLLPALENQALKIDNAGYHLDQARMLVAEAAELRAQSNEQEAKDKESEARAILKEAYGIIKLSDQAEARMLETVGMAPTRAQSPVYQFINAPTNQAIVSSEVLHLLGQASQSNLGQLLGPSEDAIQDIDEVLDATYTEVE